MEAEEAEEVQEQEAEEAEVVEVVEVAGGRGGRGFRISCSHFAPQQLQVVPLPRVPFAHLTGIGRPMPSESPWFDDLMGTPAWIIMQDSLQAERVPGASWQNLLAVHTSCCCAPGKSTNRPVESLEAAGLRFPVTDTGTGKARVTLILPELFPEMRFGATSSWHDLEPEKQVPHKKAKEELCFDILTFAMLMAPHLVRIHPNSVKEGAVSIAKLRSLGESTTMSEGPALRWQTRLKLYPPAPELTSPKSGASGSGAAGNSGDGGGTGAGSSGDGGGAGATSRSPISGATREENEAQAEALICLHYGVSPQWLNPSKLKRPVFSGLADLLPKKSLRRFLEARPNLFVTRSIAGSNAWEFQRIA